MILTSNPYAQYTAQKDAIDQAIAQVLDSGRYILGQQVKSFEKAFAAYVGTKFGVGVGSGTDALHVALRACGVGPGDEVITVSHTAVATVAAIEQCGAVPVLVDIEPDYYTLDPSKLRKAISKKTKAIVPVHLYGQPADLDPIIEIGYKHHIPVIEDCSQAHGAVYHNAQVGTFGQMACYSCYPTKNLGAIGDGGIIVTNDSELAQKAKMLREYGWDDDRNSQIPGLNSRLDEMQAAVLNVKLPHLDEHNEARRAIADTYDKLLGDTDLILPKRREQSQHVFHLYVIRSTQREKLRDLLVKNDIQAAVHFPMAVHQQQAYKDRIKIAGDLKETEKCVKEILSLPVHPQLTDEEVAKVASVLLSLYAGTN